MVCGGGGGLEARGSCRLTFQAIRVPSVSILRASGGVLKMWIALPSAKTAGLTSRWQGMSAEGRSALSLSCRPWPP
jgi:hypothetical protein